MRKKITIGIICVAVVALGVLIYNNVSIETEYTPEPEIEETEYRNTAISLYFQDKETKNMQVETRLIDSKELLKDPYVKLISLLLEGPDNSNLESAIPVGTRLISVTQEGETLVVNLSKEFLNFDTQETRVNAIYSIVNTITELKEISKIKFMIEGEEAKGFNEPFARIK